MRGDVARRAGAPLTVSSIAIVSGHVRRASAARGARAPSTSARRPRTRSIASRYSGLARIDVGDGLASANSASSTRGARVGVGRRVAERRRSRRRRRSGRGPTLPNATRAAPRRVHPDGHRDRREVVAAPPRPPLVGARDPASPEPGARSAVTSSPGASVVTPERTKNVVERDAPRARRSRDHDHRPVDEQRRRRVRGRRRVAQVPGERRPVPDLHRAHDRGRLGERGDVPPDHRVRRDVGHHRRRADDERAALARPDPRRRAPGSASRPRRATASSSRRAAGSRGPSRPRGRARPGRAPRAGRRPRRATRVGRTRTAA